MQSHLAQLTLNSHTGERQRHITSVALEGRKRREKPGSVKAGKNKEGWD